MPCFGHDVIHHLPGNRGNAARRKGRHDAGHGFALVVGEGAGQADEALTVFLTIERPGQSPTCLRCRISADSRCFRHSPGCTGPTWTALLMLTKLSSLQMILGSLV